MPHGIVLSAGRVLFTFAGVVDDAEFLTSAVELRKILEDNPDLHELVDYTNVQRFEVSASTVRALALTPTLFSGHSVQVSVAPETSIFGMLRMYQLQCQEKCPNMVVVRTLAEAEELLKPKS